MVVCWGDTRILHDLAILDHTDEDLTVNKSDFSSKKTMGLDMETDGGFLWQDFRDFSVVAP